MKAFIPSFLILVVLFIFTGACRTTKKQKATSTTYALPAWLTVKIKSLQEAPPHKLPSFVMQYTFNNQTVYYIPADCCDQLNPLYKEDGTLLCKPDGGFTGKGDGKCPDFNRATLKGILIWEDPRTKD
jgi:hypothetical protein